MGNGSITQQDLRILRAKYDLNGDNKITFPEAKQMAEEIRIREGVGQPLPDQKLLSIFNKLDEDGSGKITFEEFDGAFDLLQQEKAAKRQQMSQMKGKGKGGKGGKSAEKNTWGNWIYNAIWGTPVQKKKEKEVPQVEEDSWMSSVFSSEPDPADKSDKADVGTKGKKGGKKGGGKGKGAPGKGKGKMPTF
eukprot:CAMPEP_0169125718 /NCGR_PEP_ID=MMETSP1015-20121227/35045_1 /TAXON_ID=342587 /ORGANISM="Karlodinium micrum, Strain CCMP2283" /LENGTH=190 /DNA_ID=CAMNT_0009189295 /DNA_START=37 /DNA_END=608 /DNA_ORIENTATION=+